jgi:heme oxygenase
MIDDTSRRAILRRATGPAHASLDALVGPLDSRGAYLRYLTGNYRFRSAAEDGLTDVRWPSEFASWRPTVITRELEADLSDLGVPVPPRRAAAERGPVGPNWLLGTLYVLEGSALGARVLVKAAGKLGFDGEYGARHLARQAASLDGWRAFVEILESAGHFEIDAAVSAANEAFRAAHHAMSRSQQCPEPIPSH